MGSLEFIHLDNLTKDIWSWAIFKDIWVTTIPIPGSKSIVGDQESRLEEQGTK